jgi:hypothetical protein
VGGIPPGYALVTLFANGIPSASSILLINASRPVSGVFLTGAARLPNGAFQFAFTNTPGATFTALAATNLSLPLSVWTILGNPNEISPGKFQFTDPQAPSNPQRFYRVRSP